MAEAPESITAAPRTPNGAVAASVAAAARANGAPAHNGRSAANGAGRAANGYARQAPAHAGSQRALPAWTALPGDDGRLARAERAWRERREALERELAGAAQALVAVRDDERAAREAMRAAQADLRAVRAAREADASMLAVLSAELDAERVAHAVARATAARLAADLAAARAELAAARSLAPPLAEAQATRTTPARLDIQPAGRAAPDRPDVAEHRAPDPGRLLADLEAAAAALRRATPAPDDSGSRTAARTPLPEQSGERRLRKALVAFARHDPLAAGRLLLALLPAQAVVLEGPLSYDLTVRGLGTFAVTVKQGGADVRRIPQPRRRAEALFHLRAEALALAELLAGERRRIGRFRGAARATGRRKRTAALAPLVTTAVSLADVVRAGARLDPELVYAALPFAVEPEWTRGHAFTVAQQVMDPSPRTWYVTARDGDRLAVSEDAPAAPPDATVTMTRAGFAALLRGESPAPADRPSVRGDRAAVAALKAWTDRARGSSPSAAGRDHPATARK